MSSRASKPRILFVDLGATFGGAEIYLQDLLQSLRDEIDCFVLCSNAEFQQRLRVSQIRSFSMFSATGPLKVLQLLGAMCLLPYLVLRYRITTVQINGYAEILLIPLARLLGCNAIATRHLTFEIEVSSWRQAPGRFLARSLYRALARFATQIVCVSQAVAREVEEFVPGKVTVIPNWISHIAPFVPRYRSPRSTITLLFVGRLIEYKGLQVLLDALQLATKRPEVAQFLLIAVGDGPYRSELEKRAAALVGIKVEFTGFQRDLREYYRRADVFVSPSLGPEGSSLVTLEAMAAGLPCILSDLPVHREIAMSGKAAALFRSGDAEDLERTLESLNTDPDLTQHYARAGHDAVLLHHNPEGAKQSYLKAFGVAGVE